ncbi:MAG: LysM peptidoglycan-binding domain-containing protein [Chloroflexi bacterium]|nr:LysM peptidoglycan-binding domain-containing protein [Chloroflexota bacterium]
MTVPPETIEDPEVGSRVEHEGSPDPGANPRTSLSARDAVSGMCPYLLSAGGAWRSTTPSRDHRCSAVAPAVPQATDKQRRHCLAADHVECSLFRIARAARANNLISGADPAMIDGADRTRRPIARTAPVLLEPTRLVDQALRLRFDRGPGQLALIGLMIVAFAIVGLARLSGAAAPILPSSQPSTVAVVPSRAPTPRPSPSVAVSVAPSLNPEPSFRATYTVKKGDTLATIAARYKTTVAKIVAANGLKTKTLKIGQVLKIP